MPINVSRKPLTKGRIMLYLLILLLPLLGFTVFLVSQQTRFILPARVNKVLKPDVSLNYEELALTTPDGNTLRGILFLPQADTTSDTTLILAFSGNMHNPIGFAAYLRGVFPEKNIAIAAFSYRGYPNGITPPSTGTPSQAAMFADSETIYDTLTARLQPARTQVVGYSIGTAVGAHLASVRKVDSMALVAPIASVRRIAQERYPWLPVRLLLRHPFATEDILATLSVPTTLIYSPTDGLVPTHHVTEVLHRISPTIPLVEVPDTNHVTLAISPLLPDLLRTALGLE